MINPDSVDTRYECFLLEKDLSDIPEIYEFALNDSQIGARSYLTVQLRERGAPFGEHNKEREFDGEARINILTNDKPIGRALSDKARKEATSLRIDREGKKREQGAIVANNPAQKDGELSLEIGFVSPENHPLLGDVLGRVVSIGNALGAERESAKKQKYPQYYHNRESFMRELGDADVFARIVQFIRREIQAHYSSTAS